MNNAGPAGGPRGSGLDLQPFRGIRYVPERVGSLSAVTSPPYDVVVRPDGLHQLQSADPHNIVRLILPQAPDPETSSEQAAGALTSWLAEGILAADETPALYVYEQHGESMLQRGIIGALRLSEAEEGVVLPHEDVMPQIVAERAALMRATAANLEPLLLSYRGDAEECGTATVVDRTVTTAPLLSTTTEDGIRHTLWSVTDPASLTAVQEDLARHEALIADGHHRWATCLRLRADHPGPSPWDFGLVLLVDTARHPLQVRAIHRLLHRVPVPEALTGLKDAFRVRDLGGDLDRARAALAEAAAEGNAFLLAGDGSFHLADRPDPALLERTVPGDRPAAWRSLDATVLHSTLLDQVWRIPDTPDHIGYIHHTRAAVTKAERDGSTAVLMHPVREDVVRELARQGVTMPRKSTSFGPKPATGLVLRSLTL
ncbi:DUF1015 domain-containing protein [Streptomyces albus]|uniref:DUF1015 domain-containing protein n=1 Tax=Streptomyces albus (strain ATCC 21838 / DSM 41398 / FERM P-419 / JCM 4703 / NBRC 107858) TaxID=1081613 RepID=A0A0B5F6F7_STRA4|nr:DUF1015 domain-containing protein [Streptomyces albus]AOU80769.1 DUF1015 domain-containing protein [Streptomyces albus]AYN36475.1 DUF1015 domain-containing protein [Streptomyces albus]